MRLKILCAGHLLRYPLGGHAWHHLQYLVGLQRLGHDVLFLEHFGWEKSCYDVSRDEMTADPSYGIRFVTALFERHGLAGRWCYLAEDGTAYGSTRAALREYCRDCDLFLNLSNLNWIDELSECRRRVLVDTDPVFTQIGAHGMGGPLGGYHVLLTYGESVGRPGCSMPTGGLRWQPTRQPVVLDLWPVTPGGSDRAFTSVMNWSAYGDHAHDGVVYGQKDREFEPYFDLPRRTERPMELAVAAPDAVRKRLTDGGWSIADPTRVTLRPDTYQAYLRESAGEWCVAKHAYVSTRCGWFSDRSSAYLASGRPVVLQDTGFSDNLPCGEGLLAFRNPAEAAAAMAKVADDYERHCRAARRVAEEHFGSDRVLSDLLGRCA
jgi:glycosyltransferase involved in cell wall biosynthesis